MLSKFFVSAAAIAMAVGVAPAQPPKEAPGAPAAPQSILDRAINDLSAGWTVYGPNQTARLVDDPAVQGGAAIRVTIRRVGENPWDDGANAPIVKPIAAGDRILFAFWARAPRLAEGEMLTLPFAGITEAQEPYAQVLTGTAEIGRDWRLVEVRGTVASAQAAGRAQAAVQMSVRATTIELGPVFVLRLGAAPR